MARPWQAGKGCTPWDNLGDQFGISLKGTETPGAAFELVKSIHPSITCTPEPLSLLEIFPHVERSVFIFLSELLGFFPSVSSGISGWIIGGGAGGGFQHKAGGDMGILPLQPLGVGLRSRGGVSQPGLYVAMMGLAPPEAFGCFLFSLWSSGLLKLLEEHESFGFHA